MSWTLRTATVRRPSYGETITLGSDTFVTDGGSLPASLIGLDLSAHPDRDTTMLVPRSRGAIRHASKLRDIGVSSIFVGSGGTQITFAMSHDPAHDAKTRLMAYLSSVNNNPPEDHEQVALLQDSASLSNASSISEALPHAKDSTTGLQFDLVTIGASEVKTDYMSKTVYIAASIVSFGVFALPPHILFPPKPKNKDKVLCFSCDDLSLKELVHEIIPAGGKFDRHLYSIPDSSKGDEEVRWLHCQDNIVSWYQKNTTHQEEN